MDEPRIVVGTDDLMKTIHIWLTVIGQRRPALIRDLWTRRGEQYDCEKQEHARRELARCLAENFKTAKHEVTRAENNHDRMWRGSEKNAQ